MKKEYEELTITIPIPKHIKKTLDDLGYDYERNMIHQLREVHKEIQRCIEYQKTEAE